MDSTNHTPEELGEHLGRTLHVTNYFQTMGDALAALKIRDNLKDPTYREAWFPAEEIIAEAALLRGLFNV